MKNIALIVLFVAIVCDATIVPKPKTQFLKRKTNTVQEIKLDEDQTKSRIINGEAAADNIAPYLVSLSVSSVAYGHHCAGSIIARDWVLTAAHCITELKQLNGDVIGLPVYAGLHDRSNITDAQVRSIDFAFSHKEFTGQEDSRDIALLHITPPFNFNARVQQITLPVLNEDFSNASTSAYGWGLTDASDVVYVQQLQVGRGAVLSAKDCRSVLPEDAPLGALQLCADLHACYGDGGSPLVVQHAPGVAELVGITSWGYIPCGYDRRPTVFTEVSRFITWILEVQWAYHILH